MIYNPHQFRLHRRGLEAELVRKCQVASITLDINNGAWGFYMQMGRDSGLKARMRCSGIEELHW